MKFARVDGRTLPLRRVVLPWPTEAGLYGRSVFESARAYEGRVFRLRDHVARLRTAARLAGIPGAPGLPTIEREVAACLRANDMKDARVRITLASLDPVWAGDARSGARISGAARSSLAVFVERPPSDLEKVARGVRAASHAFRRNPTALSSAFKTGSWLENRLAGEAARRLGVFEVVLLDPRGALAEGSRSNLFWVRNGVLFTPDATTGILPGIARKVVLRLARAIGLRTREGRFRPAELLRADEAFLTNSVHEVVPLLALDGRRIGTGRPGSATRALQAAYAREARKGR
jgi:branched-subunit amino acid aminotransferase/4-amino-4-deoxychorismate lyase